MEGRAHQQKGIKVFFSSFKNQLNQITLHSKLPVRRSFATVKAKQGRKYSLQTEHKHLHQSVL